MFLAGGDEERYRQTDRPITQTRTHRNTENAVANMQKRMKPNALQRQWLTSYF